MKPLLTILSLAISVFSVSAQLAQPPLAQDIYAKKPLWRFRYTGVWNETYPYYKDPIQAKLNDCWLPAASIAVTWVNPSWISHRFYFPDGSAMHGHYFPDSEWAIVNLWNPSNGLQQNFTVNAFNKSVTEDNHGPVGGGNWWHSGITQGFQQMAAFADIYGIHPNGTIWKDYGIPAVALAMLTGYKVNVTQTWEYPSIEEWWQSVKLSTKTPIVLTTIDIEQIKPTQPEIYGNHAYAVLMTSENTDGGNKTILLRNPWGFQDWFKAQDVFENVFCMNYIDGFKELVVEE